MWPFWGVLPQEGRPHLVLLGNQPGDQQMNVCTAADDFTLFMGSSGMRRGDVAVCRSQSHHFIVDEVAEE